MSRPRGGRSWPIAAGVALAAALAIPGAETYAQSRATVGSGVVQRSWNTAGGTGREETTTSQTYVPLWASLPLGERARLVLVTGGAAARVESQAGESSLDGARAVTSRLFVPLAEGRALLQASLTLPSGKTNLTSDQLRVSQALGLPLFDFGMRQYGSGTEAGGGLTGFVLRREDCRVSIGAAGTVRWAFDLARGEGEFRPAPEWVITGGADFGLSDDGPQLRLDLAWRGFGVDRLEGRKVFNEGDQLEARLDASRRYGDLRYRGWARTAIKQDHRAPDSIGTILGEYRASPGDEFVIGGSVDRPWSGSVRVGLLVEHARVTGSQEFGRNGRVSGFGPLLTFPVGRSVVVDLSATFHWGTLDGLSGGADSRLSSHVFTLSWRAGGGQ